MILANPRPKIEFSVPYPKLALFRSSEDSTSRTLLLLLKIRSPLTVPPHHILFSFVKITTHFTLKGAKPDKYQDHAPKRVGPFPPLTPFSSVKSTTFTPLINEI